MQRNNITTFYIVRHGETEWNKIGLIQGRMDSPLTELGEKQAQQIAEQLKHIHFDEVLSSDLLRAKRTAETIALEKQLAIKTTHALREQTYGDLEGKDIKHLHILFEKWKKLSDEEQLTMRVTETAESDEEVGSRFLTFLREAAVTYKGKTVLIVTHGAMMCILLTKLGFTTYNQLDDIDNCGMIKLEADGVEFFVKETFGVRLKQL